MRILHESKRSKIYRIHFETGYCYIVSDCVQFENEKNIYNIILYILSEWYEYFSDGCNLKIEDKNSQISSSGSWTTRSSSWTWHTWRSVADWRCWLTAASVADVGAMHWCGVTRMLYLLSSSMAGSDETTSLFRFRYPYNSMHDLNVIGNGGFRHVFACCWRESVKPLQIYCNNLPLSFLV